MRAILPLALLAVTACYTPRAVEPAPDPWDGAETWGYEPLEASLFYDEYSGYAYFDLSRPANVAIFALRPGGTLEMIYPGFGVGRQMAFQAGRSVVPTVGSPFRLTGNWSVASGQGPMYILLIASDDPLDVRSFRATGTMMWLNRSAVTWNPYVALDALVGEIVPRPTTSAWTTAMHVVWPFNSSADINRRDRYVQVRCGSGMIVVVPVGALLAGYPVCPEDLQQPSEPPAKGEKTRQPVQPKPAETPQGWMTASVGDLDLRKELDRLRRENGKRVLGELEIRPFPAIPPQERGRGWARSGADRTRASQPVDRPTVERTRVTRTGQPAPKVSPPPAPPSRPASPPSKPKSKPTKPGGGGGGG